MTKSDLAKFRSLKQKANQYKERMAEIRSEMESPPIPHLTGMPSGSQTENRLERLVVKYDELFRRYAQKAEEVVEQEAEILDAIESLPERECNIMYAYYVLGLTWEEVCTHDEVHYSWSQVHRYRRRALERLKNF